MSVALINVSISPGEGLRGKVDGRGSVDDRGVDGGGGGTEPKASPDIS